MKSYAILHTKLAGSIRIKTCEQSKLQPSKIGIFENLKARKGHVFAVRVLFFLLLKFLFVRLVVYLLFICVKEFVWSQGSRGCQNCRCLQESVFICCSNVLLFGSCVNANFSIKNLVESASTL